jgi:methane/ammonia monooxygenase subunit C
MGILVALIGSLAFLMRIYARLIELGSETPVRNPYIVEKYKLTLEGNCIVEQYLRQK